MLNAARYALASFPTFGRPTLFLLLSVAAVVTVVRTTPFVLEPLLNSGITNAGQPSTQLPNLSVLGANLSVMSPLVLVFLSFPVAAQFAHEYKFKIISTTFLVAPRRLAVFGMKSLVTLLYVTVVLSLSWIALQTLSTVMPDTFPLPRNGFNSSFWYVVGHYSLQPSDGFAWNSLQFGDVWWKALLYVCGSMLVVLSLSVITKSQALGITYALVFFAITEITPAVMPYLGGILGQVFGPAGANFVLFFQETFGAAVRFFFNGQAWLTSDPRYPFAGVFFFGTIAFFTLIAARVFVRRDPKP